MICQRSLLTDQISSLYVFMYKLVMFEEGIKVQVKVKVGILPVPLRFVRHRYPLSRCVPSRFVSIRSVAFRLVPLPSVP